MKAVTWEVDRATLERRRRTGVDRFDEMWEGVLHMAPAPTNRHQEIALGLARFLADHWQTRQGGKVLVQANVSTPERWDHDYRIPDVSVVPRERLAGDDAHYARPSVVFEVRSPQDETFEKFPFYAAVEVEAVVVVDRDTKAVQVFAIVGGAFQAVPPGPDGWTLIAPLGVEVRAESGAGGFLLHLRVAGDPATERSI